MRVGVIATSNIITTKTSMTTERTAGADVEFRKVADYSVSQSLATGNRRTRLYSYLLMLPKLCSIIVA